MADKLHFSLVSPARELFSGEVDHVIAVFRQRKTWGLCLRGHTHGKRSGDNSQGKRDELRRHGWAMLA